MSDLQKVAEKGQSPIGSQRPPQDDRLARIEAKLDTVIEVLAKMVKANTYPKP